MKTEKNDQFTHRLLMKTQHTKQTEQEEKERKDNSNFCDKKQRKEQRCQNIFPAFSMQSKAPENDIFRKVHVCTYVIIDHYLVVLKLFIVNIN